MSSDTSSRSSGSPCSSPTPPKSQNSKRCNKPQMERKRRERINSSLNVLKQLVLDALKKDTSQYSKLEKADILEMTVKHLRDLQRRQLVTAASNDVTVVGKYRAGFTECATEVSRYLSSVDGLRPDVRDRLMGHLTNCVQRVSTPPMASQNDHHIQQQQQQQMRHPAMASQQVTRPIQIQIPVATSPGALPGAGVQALQLAAAAVSDVSSVTSRASSCSPPHHHQQPTSNASYSPVQATQAYIAGFHVIPNSQVPAFMLQQGQNMATTATPTPLYVSTSSLQQMTSQIQQHFVQGQTVAHSGGVSMKRQAPEDFMEHKAPPMKKMMTHHYEGVQAAAKLAINETLRDEKVWRPW